MTVLRSLHAGQKVIVDNEIEGTVVFCTETDSYSPEFLEKDWPKLDYDGVMIEQENGALVFFPSEGFKNLETTIELAV